MSDDSLPPDIQAIRKARMNSEIVKLCVKSKVAHTYPVAQGIGLYTHVVTPKIAIAPSHSESIANTDTKADLLPLGGPRRVQASKFRKPQDKDLELIYKELQDAVKAEEEKWIQQSAAAKGSRKAAKGVYGVSLDSLKEKYGYINEPASTSNIAQRGDKGKDSRRSSLTSGITSGVVSRGRTVSFASQPKLRGQSTESVTVPAKFQIRRDEEVHRRMSTTCTVTRDDKEDEGHRLPLGYAMDSHNTTRCP